MTRYLFKKIESVNEILEAIGRTDIPVNKIIVRRPCIDEQTGEILGDIEIEFADDVQLSPSEEEKLIRFFNSQGLCLKAKTAPSSTSDSR